MTDFLYYDEFKFSGKLSELAHCKLCTEPMYCIYDQKLRDYCHGCLVDMSMENARRLLGTK